MMIRKKINLLRRSLVALFIGGAVALSPATALARSDDESQPTGDARLEGYQGGAKLDISSTALTWLLLIVLGAACVGVMFINPKRSHLD